MLPVLGDFWVDWRKLINLMAIRIGVLTFEFSSAATALGRLVIVNYRTLRRINQRPQVPLVTVLAAAFALVLFLTLRLVSLRVRVFGRRRYR